jgi:hypothetical protein
MIDEMNADGDGTALVVKLGYASMAAPFTVQLRIILLCGL